MIIGPETPTSIVQATQPQAQETITLRLSPELVQELDLAQDQIVKGSVSEDGSSITISTENGTAEIAGNFVRQAGDDINVRVRSAEIPQKTEIEGKDFVTRQSKLDAVFENTSAKIDESADVEKLLTDLKAAIEGGESSVFGELNLFEDLPPVEVNITTGDIEQESWAWEAPEARETEQAELGDTYIDFGEPEIDLGEEWMGFEQLLGNTEEDFTIEIDTDIGERDHIWIQGRVQENHGRFSMWFDNPRTAAFAKENITQVAQKIESFGIILDHLGISPYPRTQVDDPPKSTFMIEV